MAILDYELWPNGSVVGPNFPSPPVLQEPPERADMPPPWDPSGGPPKSSSADWRPTASKNEAYQGQRAAVHRQCWLVALTKPKPQHNAACGLPLLEAALARASPPKRKRRPGLWGPCSRAGAPGSRAQQVRPGRPSVREVSQRPVAASHRDTVGGLVGMPPPANCMQQIATDALPVCLPGCAPGEPWSALVRVAPPSPTSNGSLV